MSPAGGSGKGAWREEVRATARGMKLVAAAAPGLTAVLLLMTAAQGAAPAVVVSATGRFLARLPDAVRLGGGSQPASDVRAAVALIAGAILLAQVLGPFQQAILEGVQRRFKAHLSRKLMESALAMPGMAYFEDPDYRNDLEVSWWIGFGPVHTLQFLTQAFRQLVQLGSLAAVAATFAGWVPAVLIAVALPGAVSSWRFESLMGMARWRGSEESRRAGYYRKLTLEADAGKELRVFGLGEWSMGRQLRHWLASMKELWNLRRRSLLLALGLQSVAAAVLAGVFLFMLRSAIDGRTGIGVFTAASIAAVGLLGSMTALFKQAARARRSSFYLPAAFRVMGLAKGDPRLAVEGRRDAAGTGPGRITFEGVGFRYPGGARKVLDGCDLEIHPGTSVALVGENGAGKTTLIKLLCRFYDPTEGRILLDGVDIREFDLASYRRRLAVIFQDFVRYDLPARHNVGFGSVAHACDDEFLDRVAAKVGAGELMTSLPQGWDTPLAREFGGVDLSGGEWQRVALARALAAQQGRGSDILILDEPTASLDVRLENELYEHFAELSRGSTTILVSHRFSTVRMAERIVLVEAGRVVEEGTHAELVAAGGRYAEMYELQASHFRLTGTLD